MKTLFTFIICLFCLTSFGQFANIEKTTILSTPPTYQSVVTDSACQDTVITGMNNTKVTFQYDITNKYNAYTIGVGSDYGNYSLATVSLTSTGVVVTNIIRDDGFLVEITATSATFNLPAQTTAVVKLFGWNSDNTCPAVAQHWLQRRYTIPN